MIRNLVKCGPLATRGLTMGARNASTLVVAEHDGASLDAATLSAVTAASAISADNVTLLVHGNAAVAENASKVAGVSKVIHSDAEEVGPSKLAENLAPVILACQSTHNFSHIVAGATVSGKNVLPRVAAKLDVNMVSEVTAVDGESNFTRLIYAGNAVCKVQSNDAVKVLTVRPTNFDAAAAEGGTAAVEKTDGAEAQTHSSWIGQELAASDRPSLTAAGVVIAGGRGMKDGDNFEMLNTMADKLGAAVGASRAAVDAGFVPNEYQIGQTGKIVAPELYIAVGISGAIQHLAGMKDSKVIACINTDEEAPIFQVSDYGLVSDLFSAVPEMTEKL